MPLINIDIDLDDLLWELSSREKQELVDNLYGEGYTPSPLDKTSNSTNSDFDDACQNLIGESWRLTKEEEEFIINLSKRFQL
jgi:hypothetical protein